MMTLSLRALAVVPVVALLLAGGLAAVPASANPIERACQQSNRAGATPSLCACIGTAAERTLTTRQMREGARFFQDPQRAQDVRQSDRRGDEELWRAWREFGETAESMCS